VRHGQVDRADPLVLRSRVLTPEEEDLAGALLSDLAGEVGRAEAAVEARHRGVGLLEAGVLGAGERQVADDVQAVPSTGRPAGHDADDDLGHEADQPLALEDVEATGACRIDRRRVVAAGVAVAVPAADALIAAGAERPAAVARRRPVAGEQHDADVARRAGVLEGGEQLVDGVRAERVADVGAVEGDAHRALFDGAVVGDVGELEAGHRRPAGRVEEV
jgi:hypothetical protein